jgi:hypothetical protein
MLAPPLQRQGRQRPAALEQQQNRQRQAGFPRQQRVRRRRRQLSSCGGDACSVLRGLSRAVIRLECLLFCESCFCNSDDDDASQSTAQHDT